MRSYSLSHLSDAVLLRDLASLIAHDRVTTAAILAHIAEVDARRLYAPAGYSSMHAYCIGELRLSEDAAFKRIRAARAGREFPILLAALAEGRLHLAAICLLAPHLTPENVNELIEAATHRRKSDIEEMLARRFPFSREGAILRDVPAMSSEAQLVPGRVRSEAGAQPDTPFDAPQHAPRHVDDARAEGAAAPPERFLLQLTIGKETREKLRYAQALLSHAVPSGDVAQVLDQALDALIAGLERRKLGADIERQSRQRSGSRVLARPCQSARRYIPAQVRRAVWERDGGQCSFVSAAGHRCGSRRFLEFDHIEPVARGGRATVEGMRLRCRTHNQYEAERAFGAGFMSEKREGARAARNMPRGMLEVTDARERADMEQVRTARGKEQAAREQIRDVLSGLRNLGCRADEARRAAELTGTLQMATLEGRMRVALMHLGRR